MTRKTQEERRKPRTVTMTDAEWTILKAHADYFGMSVSGVVRYVFIDRPAMRRRQDNGDTRTGES